LARRFELDLRLDDEGLAVDDHFTVNSIDNVEALVSIGEDADLVRRFQLKEAVLEDRKLWSAPELDVGLRLHRARVRLDSGTDEALYGRG